MPEGAAKAATEEPSATPTPQALDLVLATSAQAQGAQAVLPERHPSRLCALIQEMQSFCGFWEEDLEKAKQSDSDNAKLQHEVYELLEGTEGTFGCDSKAHPLLIRP
jgi:hypothetical protein